MKELGREMKKIKVDSETKSPIDVSDSLREVPMCNFNFHQMHLQLLITKWHPQAKNVEIKEKGAHTISG